MSESSKNAQPARAISVRAFARVRCAEIKALSVSLQTKKDSPGTNVRVFQSLPRHLRRRATSHNPRRLPYRMRRQALREKDTMEQRQGPDSSTRAAVSSRRRRRKPRVLDHNALLLRATPAASAASADDNSGDSVDKKKEQGEAPSMAHGLWLETHIWHAKRMRMADCWGLQVALRPTDKSTRATYRSNRHLVTVRDISYVSCVELTGPQKKVLQALRALSLPSPSSSSSSSSASVVDALTCAHVMNGSTACNVLLYSPSSSPSSPSLREFVGPAEAQWRPAHGDTTTATDSCTLWLWLHASIHARVVGMLHDAAKGLGGSVAVADLRGQLNRFRVLGPKAHQILNKVVLRMPTDQQQQQQQLQLRPHERAWGQVFSHASSAAQFPRRCVLHFSRVQDPRYIKRCVQPFQTRGQRSKRQQQQQGGDNHSAAAASELAHVLTSWPKELYTDCDALYDPAHREVLLERMLATDADFHRHPEHKKHAQERAVTTPCVMLIQNARTAGATGSGWDVVVPKGWGRAFFQALVYAGGRAIGVDDARAFDRECSLLSFPFDFPDTAAGQRVALDEGRRVHDRYLRTPKSKRVNFNSLAVDSPFVPDWHVVGACGRPHTSYTTTSSDAGAVGQESAGDGEVVAVSLLMDKGVAGDNAMICMPESADYAAWLKQGKAWVGPVEPKRTGADPAWHAWNAKFLPPKPKTNTSNPTNNDSTNDTNNNANNNTAAALPASSEGMDLDLDLDQGRGQQEQEGGSSRVIMGFVTAGGFSYAHSRGHGLGHVGHTHMSTLGAMQTRMGQTPCAYESTPADAKDANLAVDGPEAVMKAVKALKHRVGLSKRGKFMVLVRNASSPHYHAAVLTVYKCDSSTVLPF